MKSCPLAKPKVTSKACALCVWCPLIEQSTFCVVAGRALHKITRVLQDGKAFEKAGCNITCSESATVSSKLLDRYKGYFPEFETVLPQVREYEQKMERYRQQYPTPNPSNPAPPAAPKLPFRTASLSMVFHPVNPHAPTVHMNHRYCMCSLCAYLLACLL